MNCHRQRLEDSCITLRNFLLRDTESSTIIGNNNEMLSIRSTVMNGDRQRDIYSLLMLGYSAVVMRTFVTDERRHRVYEEMMTTVKDEAAKMRRKIVG
ncbi:uncharacterized protein [Pocillopora verrucosa]|uniref:uncharacterized protein isoform X2 n=1 Tax=Pocillopora verrucosa TaxID=203993 RepID=UPI0033418196